MSEERIKYLEELLAKYQEYCFHDECSFPNCQAVKLQSLDGYGIISYCRCQDIAPCRSCHLYFCNNHLTQVHGKNYCETCKKS